MHVQDRDGMTPLHIAASNGHLDIAEELVKRGSNLNAKMPDGCTPLCCARKYSRTNIVAYLESVALE
ncbi:ankyrin repeat-containing domain protein [Leptodontidium sp. 2 PMI_412]|nr:ankyrin repeat-containing domain protein [Leptodontidium sp. 2 PMI_412]